MVHIILLFYVLTVINISTASYTGSSPIVGLVSRYHVIQVKSDNGKGVYLDITLDNPVIGHS